MNRRIAAIAALTVVLAGGLSACAPGPATPVATARAGAVADVSALGGVGRDAQDWVNLDTLRQVYDGPEGTFFTAVSVDPDHPEECLFVVAPNGGGGIGCGAMTLVLQAVSESDTSMIYAFNPGPDGPPSGAREVADGIWAGEYTNPAEETN